MIRKTVTCRRGHTYQVVTAKNYHGAAEYPAACPDCHKRQ